MTRVALTLTLLATLACACSGTDDSAATDDAEEQGLSGDRRIDPIEVGHTWTYDVKVLGFYPACSEGTFDAPTLESVTVGGKKGKRVQSLCDGAGTFIYSVEGDRVWSWYDGAWRLSVDAPVRAGHRWSDDYFDYTWQKAGNVTVPAGTFRSCWTAKKLVDYDSYTVFCRGVGPVHWHYEDGFGNGYDAVLTDKSF